MTQLFPTSLPNGQFLWYGTALPSLAGDGQFTAGDYFFVMTASGAPATWYRCTVTGNGATAVFQQADAGLTFTAITASGAINPHQTATYVVTDAGVAAMTLAAPTATVDDGVTIIITSNTAFAHTLTATGLLQTGAAAVNVATFAAHPGAGLKLVAYQGLWNVLSEIGITFS